VRRVLSDFGVAPLAEVEGPRRAVRVIDRYGPRSVTSVRRRKTSPLVESGLLPQKNLHRLKVKG
jgi:hypothetical protein